ncbi:hypothetical protein TNIN_323621 [Trichonephila inaurata madagascariensis]|uniref:Uncharacterized protein n=1 Tax=Trichonephila inaurata madagascariensis TaxID=2747483 RepID=A0A8X6WS63_9ARAC|nr:hypothetical protein TNIN_323621 [Trichonephila inaurata madagascariensis]
MVGQRPLIAPKKLQGIKSDTSEAISNVDVHNNQLSGRCSVCIPRHYVKSGKADIKIPEYLIALRRNFSTTIYTLGTQEKIKKKGTLFFGHGGETKFHPEYLVRLEIRNEFAAAAEILVRVWVDTYINSTYVCRVTKAAPIIFL